MAAKQRPHSPEGTRLEGPDRDGVYRIIIPSESRPGKEHTLTVAYDGTPLNCTCEGNVAYLAYQMSLGTVQPNPERRPCWHWLAAADLLAHHLDPPPADPGGAGRIFAPCSRCPAPRSCARDGCRLLRGGDPGFATPLDPDDEGPFAGGAALDAAQAALDDEADRWEAELRRVRHDEGLRALYGN
jgi:hypothetical protein